MDLIILMGLQAAGKSTFFQTYLQPSGDYIYISKDLLRNNPHPERRQRRLLADALAAGQSVVVDNTNPSPAERTPLIALGKEYGATIRGYFFEPALGASLARNRQREGKARVPDMAIFATRKRLTPPTYDEGFDQLYVVTLPEAGAFQVRELR